jgi:hypothetical protein
LDIPTASIAPDAAVAHFGHLGALVGIDAPPRQRSRGNRWDGIRPVRACSRISRRATTTTERTSQTAAVLLVDAANVIGSRPTGWWRDRAGAARTFVAQVRAAVASGRISESVVIVLEGRARAGAPSGLADGVTVLHADGSGDEMLVDTVAHTPEQAVVLVSADQELRRRVEALGAGVVGPGWLLARLE